MMSIKEIVDALLNLIQILAWPITILVISFLFRKPISTFIQRLTRAELPGGIKVEAIREEIKTAQIASQLIKEEPKSIKGTVLNNSIIDPNQKMISLGLIPSPSNLKLDFYHILIDQDPNIALAGFRMDLEIMLKNLVQGFKIESGLKDSALRIAEKLKEKSALTANQFMLIKSIINVCNMAIHGELVTKEQATEVVNLAKGLVSDYIAWLDWGFRKK